MSRKVYMNLTVKVIMEIDEGKEIADIVDELNYAIESDDAIIHDTEIIDYDITDSK